MKKVLVFGTESGWKRIKKILDYKKLAIEAFVDNNRAKAGKKLSGKKIILPCEIGNYQYDYILIASQFHEEIIEQLKGLKVPVEKIIPFYACASLFKYDWLDYINPKCWQANIVIKKVAECEIEIAKKIREKNTEEAKNLLENYKKLPFNEVKYYLLKILILLEEGATEAAKDEIIKGLEEQGFILRYTPSPYRQIVFKEKAIPSFISVIIPVYKDADGLKDTLTSLHAQSIGRDKYEIIVVNDGGDTAVNELCSNYKVRVVEHKPNRGSYYARNRGIEISRGEFLAFVDADIKVPVDWLEKGVKALNDYDYIAGDINIDETKVKTLTNYYELKTAFPVRDFFLHKHFGPTANIFVKRKVFEEIGGFDERLQSAGDKEFGERIFRFTGFKQAHLKDIAVLHPPRDYRGLIKKLDRVYKGQNDLARLYPERFRFPRVRFIDLLKEFFLPPAGVVYDRNCRFGYIKIFLFYWWIKNVKTYMRMRYIKG